MSKAKGGSWGSTSWGTMERSTLRKPSWILHSEVNENRYAPVSVISQSADHAGQQQMKRKSCLVFKTTFLALSQQHQVLYYRHLEGVELMQISCSLKKPRQSVWPSVKHKSMKVVIKQYLLSSTVHFSCVKQIDSLLIRQSHQLLRHLQQQSWDDEDGHVNTIVFSPPLTSEPLLLTRREVLQNVIYITYASTLEPQSWCV